MGVGGRDAYVKGGRDWSKDGERLSHVPKGLDTSVYLNVLSSSEWNSSCG